MSCAAPLDETRLVDYWTRELADDEVTAIEDHVFACEPCARRLDGVARIVGACRDQLGPVISRAELDELRRQGRGIREHVFVPGARAPVTFTAADDLLVHHLAGLDLAGAERVALTVRSESSGAVIHHDPIAPFDAARGEVLIACQRHFAALPPDVVFDVEIHGGARPPATASYVIPHQFL